MVLWLHWLLVVMHEWARNPLKCRGSGASGEGIHLLFPMVGIFFQSIFGQPGTHPWGLFLMWHCLNANMRYLSALDKSAERVKAQLLTCPHCSPGAPQLGVQGRQGWVSLGAPGLEGIPLHCPQVKTCPFTGKLLETTGTWKNVSTTWSFWRCSWSKTKALGEFLINWDCRIRRAAEFSIALPICWLIALIKILGRFL